jgi:hypothetical protein
MALPFPLFSSPMAEFCYWSGKLGQAWSRQRPTPEHPDAQERSGDGHRRRGRGLGGRVGTGGKGMLTDLGHFCYWSGRLPYSSGRGRLHQVCFATGRASSLDWVGCCYWSGRGRSLGQHSSAFCYWSGVKLCVLLVGQPNFWWPQMAPDLDKGLAVRAGR